MKRVVLAGTGSGVGKTAITTGIMSLLSRHHDVQGYKIGPDFIDPMWHTLATGRASRNLDTVMMSPQMVRKSFARSSTGADLAVIEGVRGLYEGIDPLGDEGSTAHVAKILQAPVVLVMNAQSLTRSAAAVVKGFKELDPMVRVEGVILNHVRDKAHCRKATKSVEGLTDTEVIGCVCRGRSSIPERHLGLITVHDDRDRDHIGVTEDMVEGVDLDRLLDIMERAPDLDPIADEPLLAQNDLGGRVAVPYDPAFCFYYPENLEALTAAGAEVVHFSPLAGDPLPEADAYYLGGGYPELHLDRLAENRDFLEGLRTAVDDGRVVIGECGGLMCMCDSIIANGKQVPMAGVFNCDAVHTDSKQGLAYVRAGATADNFLGDHDVVAHEFHYSCLKPVPNGPFAYRMRRGTGIDGAHDGLVRGRAIGTYMHQHALSDGQWGLRLVRAACELNHEPYA